MNEHELKLFSAIGDLSDETIRAALEPAPPRTASRGKTYLRAGLIAACLAVFLLAGLFFGGSRWGWFSEAPADETQEVTVPGGKAYSDDGEKLDEAATKNIYVYPSVDPSAPVSKAGLYNRMLNTVDFFNTVSISFSYCFPNANPNEIQVTIDSDLPFGKAYQSYLVAGSDEYFEDICDGVSIVRYSHRLQKAWVEMPALLREEGPAQIMPNQEQYYSYLEGNPNSLLYRKNITNASAASWCLFPQEFTFGFLNQLTAWDITEDTEVLGRKSVTLKGTAPEYYQNKFGIETFSMCVDKATGIILSFEGYNSGGALVNYVHVSELIIDDYEETRARIDKAAATLANLGFEITKFEDRFAEP